MALNIVTDTDVAAVQYATPPKFSFRLDRDNKGPFAAMLPLSDVLTPAREKDCIARLAEQCAAIPYNRMRDNFLQDTGVTYAQNAMIYTVKNQMEVEGIKHTLLKAGETPPPRELKLLGEALHRHMMNYGLKDGQEAIADMAKKRNLGEEEAVKQLYQNLVILDRPMIAEAQAFKTHELKTPAMLQRAGKIQAEIMDMLLAPLPDSAAIRKAAITGSTDKEQSDSVGTAFRKAMQHATPEQKNAMMESLAATAKKYAVQEPAERIMDSVSGSLYGRGMCYTLNQMEGAKALSTEPTGAAQKLYEQLRTQAGEQKATPKTSVASIMPQLMKALADCPAHIRKSAETMALKVVVVEDDVNINNIIPNNMGITLSTLMGGSTGQGIYIKRKMLGQPIVLKEEIIHEVEGRALHTTQGQTLGFSDQPSWQKAMIADTAKLTPEAAYAFEKPIFLEIGVPKSNNAIGRHSKPLTAKPHDPHAFAEALADIYHYAAIIQKELEIKKPIRIGANKLGFGGKKYPTTDEFMRTAFPNAWPLLEGARQGNQLAQHADGRVEELPATTPIPSGAQRVISLKEYCEGALHHADVDISNRPANSFARRAEKSIMPELMIKF